MTLPLFPPSPPDFPQDGSSLLDLRLPKPDLGCYDELWEQGQEEERSCCERLVCAAGEGETGDLVPVGTACEEMIGEEMTGEETFHACGGGDSTCSRSSSLFPIALPVLAIPGGEV